MKIKKISSSLIKKRVSFLVSAICAYALYLRISFLYKHTLWADEFWQLDYMKGTFLDLLKGIPKVEFCSYLSGHLYLTYPFFKIFSYNKWGLAIPHLAATLIGFCILYLICRRHFKSLWAYLITFGVVCFNATLIKHATEIRAYAALPTLALAAFYLFQKIADLDFKLNASKKTAAVLFFIFVIWFHVYGILMVMGSFICALLFKYNRDTFKTCSKNAFSLLGWVLCLAMPFWFYCVFGPHYVVAVLNIDPFMYIPSPLVDMPGFLKNVVGNLIGSKQLYFIFPGVIIPFVFSYSDRYRQLLFLFSMVIFPILFILFLDIAGKYWFLQRQFIWTMPLFAFFLGWVWDSFFVFLEAHRAKK